MADVVASLSEVLDLESVNLIPGQGEDEGDLEDPASGFNASISGKDWTVETLVSQMRKGRIDLSPTFQRRNAWLDNRKSKLLESIMLGFPIPQIVLAEQAGKPGHYFVLDGKQRLLALRQFFVDRDNASDDEFNPLTLTGLEVLKELNGSDLTSLEHIRPDLVAATENHSIRTVALANWNSERLLLSLFLRLNTGSVALSPQELRQALIHGDFMAWLDAESGEMPEVRRLLNNMNPDRRMVDAELLLRFLAFDISPLKYQGSLKTFLDGTSDFFTEDWGTQKDVVKSSAGRFASALSFGLDLLSREVFAHKWTVGEETLVGKYERALNRALLDVQAYSFSIESVRDSLVGKGVELESAFKVLCQTNDSFVRSISATTKTAEAFRIRHRAWRQVITEVGGATYDLPAPLLR